jgi:hypothetical protein
MPACWRLSSSRGSSSWPGSVGGTGCGALSLLAAVSLLWLVVNGPMEGDVLLGFTGDHGLTGGDLAGLAGLALAGFRAYRVVRRRWTG